MIDVASRTTGVVKIPIRKATCAAIIEMFKEQMIKLRALVCIYIFWRGLCTNHEFGAKTSKDKSI